MAGPGTYANADAMPEEGEEPMLKQPSTRPGAALQSNRRMPAWGAALLLCAHGLALADMSRLEAQYEAPDYAVQRAAIEMAATRTLADLVLGPARLPGSDRTASIARAMKARSDCNTAQAKPGATASYCATEVRSLRMLARQYAQQAWLERDGPVLMAQGLLCAAASGVKGPDLPKPGPLVSEVLRLAKEEATALFEPEAAAVSEQCSKEHVLERLQGQESAGTLSAIAKNYAAQDAIQLIGRFCNTGLRLDAESRVALRRAIQSCSDRGANTDEEALQMLDRAEEEAQTRLQEATNELMTRFLQFKGQLISRETQLEFPAKCVDGFSRTSWDPESPWRFELSCFFGSTQTWHFDPLADDGVAVSQTEVLRRSRNEWLGDRYSTLERASRQWMKRYLGRVQLARRLQDERCQRDTQGMRNRQVTYVDLGSSFELLCSADRRPIWRAAYQVDREGRLSPDPEKGQ